MQKPFCTPIQEILEFDRVGHHYTRLCESNGFYLFKMEGGHDYPQFEIWKGKNHKQPDGTVIQVKPGSEDFGAYGWYLCGDTVRQSLLKLRDSQEGFPYEEFLKSIEGEQ